MNYYYDDPTGFYRRREEKRKDIKRLGLLIGVAFLLYVVLQNIISLIAQFTGLLDKYWTDSIYQSAIDTVIIIISLLVPFYFMGKRMKKISRVEEPLSLDKPVKIKEFLVATVAGVGVCMLANIVTSYLTLLMEAFSVHPEAPEIAMPTGIKGVTITIVRVIICAAMAEEISMRGYVMGNLRSYGDKFAILMSSVMFAAMHGNLVQAPFALIAGFAIGYFSIKTGSIWTGIAIHALNNGISVAITYAAEYLSETTTNLLSVALIYGLILLGGVALVAFIAMTKDKRLTDNCPELSLKEKCGAFVLNPAMLITFAYMIFLTILNIKIG
ncbi:MAG: CPBP family intramembrane metalloprotease [Clostridia bacterium]|nr:CPBP family intramembrane metalloprotease [Clostridia bacterium]